MDAPESLLAHLYTVGTLENVDGGVRFALKNRLFAATLTGVSRVELDGRAIPPEDVTLELGGREFRARDLDGGVPFPLRQTVHVRLVSPALDPGTHTLGLTITADPFGTLSFDVADAVVSRGERTDRRIPRADDNTSPAVILERRRFVERVCGADLHHVAQYSLDPAETEGNVENFIGVAQVPIGVAGPLRVNGEHAQGEFLIPMATSEGTLVASYNRGMKLLNAAGGVTCTVADEAMQRAPVFVFDSAREARSFRDWVDAHIDELRSAAEATTSRGKLIYIDTFLASRYAYLRFNFTTGDAAGQNMVGRATFAACSWILERVEGVRHFYLESNLGTDKKASQLNTLRTRGKRVTAEALVPASDLEQVMRASPAGLQRHAQAANVGAFLSGVNNNGLHSANGITALFIATGQDVANVAESSAGILHTELTPTGDLYVSITIPSLIVGTVGGGTGLATQRECLDMLACRGEGKARKLAEIVAGVVLAGELSLASAISSLDWVSSHEQYGRNRA